jgi:hypothetical protein
MRKLFVIVFVLLLLGCNMGEPITNTANGADGMQVVATANVQLKTGWTVIWAIEYRGNVVLFSSDGGAALLPKEPK